MVNYLRKSRPLDSQVMNGITQVDHAAWRAGSGQEVFEVK